MYIDKRYYEFDWACNQEIIKRFVVTHVQSDITPIMSDIVRLGLKGQRVSFDFEAFNRPIYTYSGSFLKFEEVTAEMRAFFIEDIEREFGLGIYEEFERFINEMREGVEQEEDEYSEPLSDIERYYREMEENYRSSLVEDYEDYEEEEYLTEEEMEERESLRIQEEMNRRYEEEAEAYKEQAKIEIDQAMNAEGMYPAIHSWYIVSEYLANELSNLGEIVVDYKTCFVWGRRDLEESISLNLAICYICGSDGLLHPL